LKMQLLRTEGHEIRAGRILRFANVRWNGKAGSARG
jgi:hypothetical protein